LCGGGFGLRLLGFGGGCGIVGLLAGVVFWYGGIGGRIGVILGLVVLVTFFIVYRLWLPIVCGVGSSIRY
jgi:hypothetical protein